MKRIVIILIPLLVLLVGCDFFQVNLEERRILSATENAINELGDYSKVTEDLHFITSYDSITITWQSSNPDVVSNNGKVTRTAVDVLVTLTMLLESETKTVSQEIVVTVLKENIEEIENSISIKDLKYEKTGNEVIIVATVYYFISDNDVVVTDDTGSVFLMDITDEFLSSIQPQKTMKIKGKVYIDNNVGLYISEISEAETLFENSKLNDELILIDFAYSLSKKRNGEFVFLDKAEIVKYDTSATGLVVTLSDGEFNIDLYVCECMELYRIFKGFFEDDNLYQVSLSSAFVLEYDGKVKLFASNNTVVEENILIKDTTSFKAKSGAYKGLQDKLEEDNKEGVGLPSTGTSKILVIPIEFTDALLQDKYPDGIERLRKALFGTESDTGYESLNSYYKKSSYGLLDIQGDILPVYSTGRSSSYYKRMYNRGGNADYEIIKEALAYYDNQVDYKDYDTNNDGYIDAIYFIYTAPVDYIDDSLWWAYVYQYMTDDYEYYNLDEGISRRVEANYYLWAGFDFMDETIEDLEDVYNPKKVKVAINASTFIHETGHLMGLDDYYDYDTSNGPAGGLGGADMMDYTVGDHNPFSKIMLGWTTPYIIQKDTTEYSLSSFEKTGDTILITKKWNDSYFSEYLLLSYYTPTGLNRIHKGMNGLFEKSGVIIYHVIATADDNVGSRYNADGYWTLFSYNNSDTVYKLISIVEADGGNDISSTKFYPTGNFADDSDLFQTTDVFGYNTCANFRWYDGTRINFKIYFSDMTENHVNVKVEY